jgi:hypothetical protein
VVKDYLERRWFDRAFTPQRDKESIKSSFRARIDAAAAAAAHITFM